MKRDMDLLRNMLITIESCNDVPPNTLRIELFLDLCDQPSVISMHLELLKDAQYDPPKMEGHSTTLAMMLEDHFGSMPGWETTLLATDLSKDVLEKGKEGIYAAESVKTLPALWQNSYFHRTLANTTLQKWRVIQFS